jgi:multicomponent K+:H+ antiporter subunit F
MLEITLTIAIGCTALAMLIAAGRLVAGPSAPDRILAIDALYVYTVALAVLLGIRHDSNAYFETALLIALMGFVTTVALARYVIRGSVTE